MFKICLKPLQQGTLNVFTQGLGRLFVFRADLVGIIATDERVSFSYCLIFRA